MFRITEGKGFQIVFANGYEASVQFGPGNYCANRNKRLDSVNCLDTISCECTDAEVGVFGPDNKPYHLDGQDDVWIGHVKPNELPALLQQIAAL